MAATHENTVRETLNLLVIDDDVDDQFLLQQHLSPQGCYRLRFVDNAADALKAMRSETFDACLLDHQLDRGTGLDLLRQVDVKALPGPVIMITDNRDPHIDQAALLAGAADYLRKDELNQGVLDRCLRYTIEQYRMRRRAEKQALSDPLTGVLNRDAIIGHLNSHIEDESCKDISVLYLDLDGFKSINDGYGHQVGDQVLTAIANSLQKQLGKRGRIGRFGGDEFLAVLPLSSANEGEKIGEELMQALRQGMAETPFIVTASIGLSHWPSHGRDAQELVQRADQAMYEGKKDGRNLLRRYNDKQARDIDFHRGRIAQDLRSAIHENQLRLVYQPQFANDGETIVGAEALCRWDHPEFGAIAPDFFINIAETGGMIRELEHWALGKALEDLRLWHKSGRIESGQFKLSVNVSSLQFLDDIFVRQLEERFRDDSELCHMLELEITEHSMVRDFNRASNIIEQIQKLGIAIAIDDFGIQNSSLAYLARLPVDTIKIDRVFVTNAEQGGRDHKVLRALAALVRELGSDLVIEGIETIEQFQRIKPLNSDRLQGFYFARPVDPESFKRMLVCTMAPVVPLHKDHSKRRA